MCFARNNPRRGAFTLLEVILAVMIMAMIAIVIYRFVVTGLESIRLSNEEEQRKEAVQALVAVLQDAFANLPPSEQNALLGEAHEFNNKSSDQVEWLCSSGNGLFTATAPGSWRATLVLRPGEKPNTYTLGLLRQLPDNSSSEDHWLPLLPEVDAIEIRYFDQRLNAWLQKWSDAQSRPSLVRFRIWRTGEDTPFEKVIELPPTRLPS